MRTRRLSDLSFCSRIARASSFPSKINIYQKLIHDVSVLQRSSGKNMRVSNAVENISGRHGRNSVLCFTTLLSFTSFLSKNKQFETI